jgi:hemerythrin superfamily protein
MTQQANQDVVTTLLAQHQQVKQLFSTLEKVAAAKAEEPFCELRRMLSVHETAEEELIYPMVRSFGDAAGRIADACIAEESKAKAALAELEKLDTTAPAFSSQLAAFKRMVLEHAEHEEQEVFPLLREHCSSDRLEALATAFKVAEAAAPTHPHPHGPDSALGNLVVGPAVAIMDRVRDAIHHAKT